MSSDEEGRLIIDDGDYPDYDNNHSRVRDPEEGEITDEEMDEVKSNGDSQWRNSCPTGLVVSNRRENTAGLESPEKKRKREIACDGESVETNGQTDSQLSPKKKMRSLGVGVSTQVDREDGIFTVPTGSSATIQVTVVCRMDTIGGDLIYVTANCNGRELNGILTEGNLPGLMNKKRPALDEKGTVSGQSTPNKNRAGNGSREKRGVRGGSVLTDKKRKPDKVDGDEVEDISFIGDYHNGHLVDPIDNYRLHVCPHSHCEYRFPRGIEMEYHLASIHGKAKAIMDSVCTQTESCAHGVVSEGTMTGGGDLPEEQQRSIDMLIRTATNKDEQPKRNNSAFSDISDESPAPQLQKEIDIRPSALSFPSSLPSTMTTSPLDALQQTVVRSLPEGSDSLTKSVWRTVDKPLLSSSSSICSLPIASSAPSASSFTPSTQSTPRIQTTGIAASPRVSLAVATSSSASSSTSSAPAASSVAPPHTAPFLTSAFPFSAFPFPPHITNTVPGSVPRPADRPSTSTSSASSSSHKIHELKTKQEAGPSSSQEASTSSLVKPMPSPATARPPNGGPVFPPNISQPMAMHHMQMAQQQQQIYQQMLMAQMGRAMPPFHALQGASPEQMAQLMHMQASMYGAMPQANGMFPK